MLHDCAEELSSIARLARQPDVELRPLLLKVQAQELAGAVRHDPESLGLFEALALGLIPLVTDDVLAEVRAILAGVPEAPDAVMVALRTRLDRLATPTEETAGPGRRMTTPASMDPDAPDGPPPNAPIPDPLLGTANREAAGPISPAVAVLIRSAAVRGDLDGVIELIRLGRDGEDLPELSLSSEAGQDAFVHELRGAGLSAEDSIYVLLSVGHPCGRDVKTVFRLAALARSISTSVLSEAPLPQAAPRRPTPRDPATYPASTSGRSDLPARSSMAIHQRS